MSDTFDKILSDLDEWRSYVDTHPPLGQMIADTRAMTREAHQTSRRLTEQRAQITERFGAPQDRTLKGLQLKGRKPPPGADDGGEAFGAAWPGADALLARARDKGAELDDGMAALIKFTDRVIKSQAKADSDSDGGDDRTEKAKHAIAAMAEPGDGLVALILAASAYLTHVLDLQVFERRDDEFRQALKADGVDDIARVILGGIADKLPFSGVTYGFVTAMNDFEKSRTPTVDSADACMEFLKVYKLQLHMWKSGALRHAAIADTLLARKG